MVMLVIQLQYMGQMELLAGLEPCLPEYAQFSSCISDLTLGKSEVLRVFFDNYRNNFPNCSPKVEFHELSVKSHCFVTMVFLLEFR